MTEERDINNFFVYTVEKKKKVNKEFFYTLLKKRIKISSMLEKNVELESGG